MASTPNKRGTGTSNIRSGRPVSKKVAKKAVARSRARAKKRGY